MTTGEILRAAAARVRLGWCQGVEHDGHGNVCAAGALHEAFIAAKQVDTNNTVRNFLDRALHLPPPKKDDHGTVLLSIAVWNDTKGQTAENVALGFKLAALLWEQEHAQEAAWTSSTVPFLSVC